MKALKTTANSDDENNSEDAKAEATGSIVTESLLNFVDLAGSEKVSNHHLMAEDLTLLPKETNQYNLVI